MSFRDVFARADPKPTGEAFEQLARAAAALTPDPLPDLSNLPSFRNAPNLAWLYCSPPEPRHVVPGQAQQIERTEDWEEPEPDVRESYPSGQVPFETALPDTAARNNKRKRTHDPRTDVKLKDLVDRSLLAGKHMIIEAYLFDAALGESETAAPWHDLGTVDIVVADIKRPIDLVNVTIAALGGQEELCAMHSKHDAQTDAKLVGNGVIWSKYNEPGRNTAECWHYCTSSVLSAFLVDWLAQEEDDDPEDLRVKVLMWRREDARKANTARRNYVPMKAIIVKAKI